MTVSETDARPLVHELQVYQIELEMQNEELQRAQAAAEEASRKYGNLFDFSPVAYFVWDHEGQILEVNLGGAALLGLDRGMVVHKRFGQFVAMEYRARFADFCRRVLLTDAKQTCEAKILKDGQAVDVMVEGIAAQDRQGQERLCRAAVIDISQRKRVNELAAADAAAASTTSSQTRPPSPPATAVFDLELALKRCLNKPQLLQQMIGFFFKDMDHFLPQCALPCKRAIWWRSGGWGTGSKGLRSTLRRRRQEKPHCASNTFCDMPANRLKPRKLSARLSGSATSYGRRLTEYLAATNSTEGGR